jgi:integrase/recombinase XerD
MSRKGANKKTRAVDQVIGPLGDPGSLYFQLRQFLQHLRERGYSERTVENREGLLIAFIRWCDERGLTRPQDITRPILERYQRHLFLHRKANGEALSARSQVVHITSIRVWFKWLTKTNRILYNPASDLDLPRIERRLPKHILSSDEAEKILNVPDINTLMGIRDRAMLETLYSTGMRRMELIGLSWSSIDYERGTVMIRQGKGKKDRMIPIGERALAWIKKYRDDVRPQYALAQDDGTLFLTRQGEVFNSNHLSQVIREHIDAAEIGKRGSCHLFRHTMATLMLENGADIRFIQAMLGHASLETTQVYTQVSIRTLKEIHTATHPARLQRQRSASETLAKSLPEDPIEALLTVLDAEENEERELA